MLANQDEIYSLKKILATLPANESREGLNAIIGIERQFVGLQSLIEKLREELKELQEDNQELKKMFSKGINLKKIPEQSTP